MTNNEPFKCWFCPACEWVESDACYLSIVIDPDCPGCGAKKYSEFQYCHDVNELPSLKRT